MKDDISEGRKPMPKHLRTATLAWVGFAFIASLHAQNTTRHIWDSAFLAPKVTESKKGPASRKPRYTVLTPKIPFHNVDPSTVVGITVWRLHESKARNSGERLLVHEGSNTVELEPRRVSARTLFRKNDRVRISVETAREGYLYVVDRERFESGKQGEPHLIFPAEGIRGGENHVAPGQIVEIPAQDDEPPYFKMRRNRPGHIGEQLTVVITPTPLKDIVPKEGGQTLSEQQCALWEKGSYEDAGMAEMTNNPALDWSKEEKRAGLDPASHLLGDAPLPQTLFYSPDASAQVPTVVKLLLNYAPPGQPRKQ